LTNEELSLIRTIMREEVGNLRGAMREEINAAVYASEQRINERFERIDQRFELIDQRFERIDQRFERIDQRFERIDQRLNRIEAMIQPMQEHLILLRAGQKQMQSDMIKVQHDLEQTVAVLNEATIAINDLQAGQRALEIKLDDHITIYRRDMQRLTKLVQGIDQRLTRHENTPIDLAHPRTHPPAPGSVG